LQLLRISIFRYFAGAAIICCSSNIAVFGGNPPLNTLVAVFAIVGILKVFDCIIGGFCVVGKAQRKLLPIVGVLVSV
jgi:hypothetical protein